jgi:hypothetical protein
VSGVVPEGPMPFLIAPPELWRGTYTQNETHTHTHTSMTPHEQELLTCGLQGASGMGFTCGLRDGRRSVMLARGEDYDALAGLYC